MKDFDEAAAEFTRACALAVNWKHEFMGAAYRTRIDRAFALICEAHAKLVRVDDSLPGGAKRRLRLGRN